MHLKGMEWCQNKLEPLLKDKYEIKKVSSDTSDLGKLEGLEFNTDEKGGYIFFWSSGYIGYQLVDFEKEIELIEDTTEELGDRSYDDVFGELIKKL